MRDALALSHGKLVIAMAFSPDGRWLATACGKAARIWDVTTLDVVRTFAHEGVIPAVAFSPDGGRLATVSGSVVSVWELGEADSHGTQRS
jgi:WD40 repeat protein